MIIIAINRFLARDQRKPLLNHSEWFGVYVRFMDPYFSPTTTVTLLHM